MPGKALCLWGGVELPGKHEEMGRYVERGQNVGNGLVDKIVSRFPCH